MATISGRFAAFERRVRAFVRGKLLECGRAIRRRMIREQLSFPADFGRAPRWAKIAAWRLRKDGKAAQADQLLAQHGERKLAFGVRRRSGNLIRSLRYRVESASDAPRLDQSLGVGAPYAEGHQSRGLIDFGRVARQEFERTLEEIQIGLQIIADGGEASVTAGGEVLEFPGSATGGERAALLGELGAHFRAKRARAREWRMRRKAA